MAVNLHDSHRRCVQGTMAALTIAIIFGGLYPPFLTSYSIFMQKLLWLGHRWNVGWRFLWSFPLFNFWQSDCLFLWMIVVSMIYGGLTARKL